MEQLAGGGNVLLAEMLLNGARGLAALEQFGGGGNMTTLLNTTRMCGAGNDSDIGVAFGTILFVGIGLSYVSQHVKLLRTRSTAGLSWAMIFVANISNWCSLLNVLLLSHTFECCRAPSTSSRECYSLFLPLLQIGMPAANLAPIFVMFLLFHKPHRSSEKLRMEGSLWRRAMHWADAHEGLLARVSFAVFVCVFVVGFSIIGAVISYVPGAGNRTLFAIALGGMAALTNMVQWMPQIFSTLRNGKVGSLSIIMLALQVPGGLAVVLFNTVVSPSSITTWGPFVLSAAQQFILLVICIVFSIRDWRARRKGDAAADDEPTTDADETTALVVNY
jgi:uncharacterized protein with PQ loop repeat